jgi:hypothetical protein
VRVIVWVSAVLFVPVTVADMTPAVLTVQPVGVAYCVGGVTPNRLGMLVAEVGSVPVAAVITPEFAAYCAATAFLIAPNALTTPATFAFVV